MRTLCDVCEAGPARLFCAADEAALCEACDKKVHGCNKLASRHIRLELAEARAVPRCDICENAPAFFYCGVDGTSLCLQCDMEVHIGGKKTHERYLLLGQRVELPNNLQNMEPVVPPVSSPVPVQLPIDKELPANKEVAMTHHHHHHHHWHHHHHNKEQEAGQEVEVDAEADLPTVMRARSGNGPAVAALTDDSMDEAVPSMAAAVLPSSRIPIDLNAQPLYSKQTAMYAGDSSSEEDVGVVPEVTQNVSMAAAAGLN